MADVDRKKAANPVQIVGRGTAAEIPEVKPDTAGDRRLFVDSQSNSSIPVPSKTINHELVILESGVDENMNVNGSVTPVIFEAGPPAGQTWYLNRMGIFIQDLGTLDPRDFGSLAELANGVLVESVLNSTVREVFNIKSNIGISFLFSESFVLAQSSGWLNTNKLFVGGKPFRPNYTLVGDDGDKLRATVQDDLSLIEEFVMAFEYWRVV